MTDFLQDFWKDVDKAARVAVDRAEKAKERSVLSNFGKLTITPRYLKWENRMPTEVTKPEYDRLGEDEKQIELTFAVDIKEFNPDLAFAYERRVGIGSADWSQILTPSLEEMGGNSSSEFLSTLQDKYVESQDVPQVKWVDGELVEQEYKTIRFVKVFKDRAECLAAHTARYGDQTDKVTDAGVSVLGERPDNYEAPAWDSMIGDLREALLEKSTLVSTLAGLYEVDEVHILRAIAPEVKKAFEQGETAPSLAQSFGTSIKTLMQVKNG